MTAPRRPGRPRREETGPVEPIKVYLTPSQREDFEALQRLWGGLPNGQVVARLISEWKARDAERGRP
jgi:hypothetical protein